MELYGRVFKIVDCDEFTRNFTGKIGVLQKPRLQIPEDPYSDHRKAVGKRIDHAYMCLFVCVYVSVGVFCAGV